MISAPSSSRTSWVRPLTVACVPTGMNTGVSITPCGVVKRPQRAPVASVLARSKEKLTHPVYQEKMKAQPTRHTTKAAQTVKAMVNGFVPFNFFGFTAENPIARSIKIQNTKMSKDLHSATSHLADSSGNNAAKFEASGFSKSTVPYGFKNSIRIKSGVLT